MASIQLVETSLRDGNQSLWAALGVDTGKALSIAPVMERVGFKAIDLPAKRVALPKGSFNRCRNPRYCGWW